MFRRLKAALLGSPSVRPILRSGAVDTVAQAEDAPPPGSGWRVAPKQNHRGHWIVWEDNRAMGAFVDREVAHDWVRRMSNNPPEPPVPVPLDDYATTVPSPALRERDGLDESGHSQGFGVTDAQRIDPAWADAEPPAQEYDAPQETDAQAEDNPERRAARAQGLRWWVEGPKDDGLFWLYTRDPRTDLAEPVKGYTRRRNAQAVANDRLADG